MCPTWGEMFILSSIGVESKKRENFTKLITKTKQKYHYKKTQVIFSILRKLRFFPLFFKVSSMPKLAITHFSQVPWIKRLPRLALVLPKASIGWNPQKRKKSHVFFMRPSGRNLGFFTSPKLQVILAPAKPGVALLCRCLLDRIRCLGFCFSLNSPRVYPFFLGDWRIKSFIQTRQPIPFVLKKISQSVQFFGWVPFLGGSDFFLAAHKQG